MHVQSPKDSVFVHLITVIIIIILIIPYLHTTMEDVTKFPKVQHQLP